ncbi:MAG: hypothetical protein ACRDUW_08185 [Pseudonocardiaceae bacterium]
MITPIRPAAPRDYTRSRDESALTAVRARIRTQLTARVRVVAAVHTAPPSTGQR